MFSQKHSRWVYLAPALHLLLCTSAMLGYLVPSLQFLGVEWVSIMILDFPISGIAIMTVWSHETFATVWMFVAGTLWWYFLSLMIENRARRKKPGN